MAAKKKKKGAKKSAAKKAKGTLPLKVLEARAAYLVSAVQRRGGTVRTHKGVLTHRTPKMVGKSRRGKKRKGKRGKR